LLIALLGAGGCLADAHYGVHAAVVAPAPTVVVEAPPPPPPQGGVYVEASVEQPELVEVQPGIQVIYDYDQPVFFSDGFYWRQEGGIWYSSRVHTGGWGRANPPERFRTINSSAYVHYRPANYQPRVRDHREPVRQPEPMVRDHRTEVRPEPVRQPEPMVRDHRTEVRPEPVRQPEPVVRDHRTDVRPAPAAPAPVVRDHRTEVHPAPPPPPKKDDHTRDHR
jgi:hypothetical protein